jgi:hypothetical protein
MDRAEAEGLKPYCTESQWRKILAFVEHGSSRKAAQALNVNKSTINRAIQATKIKAASGGWSPEADTKGLAPPGYRIKGKSTLLGPDKEVKLQWVKTTADLKVQHEQMLATIEESVEDLRGLSPTADHPPWSDDELLAVYPYGDPHVGLKAWGGPKGDAEANFDLKIAKQIMVEATQRLVTAAPPARHCLMISLGDFFHSDTQSNTTRSGHQLDVDNRFPKVVDVGIHTQFALIQLALAKHQNVHVIIEIGNHDSHTAIFLARCINSVYHNEPRVTVDLSADRFHYFQFGQNLIGTHHGDLAKPDKLPGIMADRRAKEWGETKHRVWYTGHVHNQRRFDLPGCQVESFRILPPRDAWAQSMGYGAGRSMDCIIRHRTRGEISRHTVHADELD